MKKMILGFALLSAMAFTVSVFAASSPKGSSGLPSNDFATNVTMEGSHCTGTVGCNCSGFSPITNGEVWQQSYCKHCGHKKSCHK